MKLVPTRRTDYAIRALIHLATTERSPVAAAAIGEAMDLPTGFLQQVLRELHRGRTWSPPARARRWGSSAWPDRPTKITMLQIVEAMEGPLRS